MKNFKYSLDNKRYHTFNYHLKSNFGCKVAKVSLNAGFTCPNRDGTKGYGGCIFCSDSGSGDFAGNVQDSLEIQFENVSQMMRSKWPNCKYIAYFQANTNTYGSLKRIKECVHPFINKKDVVGISIATRADCLSDEIIKYLAEVNTKTDLWVELGLQTIHDKSAAFINRGHTYKEFVEGLDKLRAHNIKVCVHIMNGLPHETIDMMLETAKAVGKLDIQALKIHMLYVIENTALASIYKKDPFPMLTREEYISLVAKQLTYIPSHIIMERLTGDGNSNDLIAPLWSIRKVTILNDIDKEMKEKDYYQGSNLRNTSQD
ncbi:MAG: TIGR01212 family radical SAM protein [Coprobacillaceae bacterium]